MKESQGDPASEPEQEEDENREEVLGRGARTRAKVSILFGLDVYPLSHPVLGTK